VRDGFVCLAAADYRTARKTWARLHTSGDPVIVPDLLACRDGRACWIDVKVKATPLLHRVSGRWEHGIDAHLVTHYSTAEAASGIPVWLLFCEGEAGRILALRLADALGACRWYRGPAHPPMANFAVARMTEIGPEPGAYVRALGGGLVD
jgi:hypothetical protein